MSTHSHVATVGAVMMMLFSWPAADSRAATQGRLADATALTCTFPVIVTGTWTHGEPEAELGTSTLSFQFVEVDTDGGNG